MRFNTTPFRADLRGSLKIKPRVFTVPVVVVVVVVVVRSSTGRRGGGKHASTLRVRGGRAAPSRATSALVLRHISGRSAAARGARSPAGSQHGRITITDLKSKWGNPALRCAAAPEYLISLVVKQVSHQEFSSYQQREKGP